MVKTTTMLRQQADRIKELEHCLIVEQEHNEMLEKENNEPVAWIGKDELQFGFTETTVTNEKESWDDVPLYTRPSKQLSDDDIGQIWKNCMESPYMQVSNPVGFARAILRKAQEK